MKINIQGIFAYQLNTHKTLDKIINLPRCLFLLQLQHTHVTSTVPLYINTKTGILYYLIKANQGRFICVILSEQNKLYFQLGAYISLFKSMCIKRWHLDLNISSRNISDPKLILSLVL